MNAWHRDVHRVTHEYVQHNSYIYRLATCILTEKRIDSKSMRQSADNLVGITQDV